MKAFQPETARVYGNSQQAVGQIAKQLVSQTPHNKFGQQIVAQIMFLEYALRDIHKPIGVSEYQPTQHRGDRERTGKGCRGVTTTERITEESSGISSGKTEEQIVGLLSVNGKLTIPELADTLGISTRVVEKQIAGFAWARPSASRRASQRRALGGRKVSTLFIDLFHQLMHSSFLIFSIRDSLRPELGYCATMVQR